MVILSTVEPFFREELISANAQKLISRGFNFREWTH